MSVRTSCSTDLHSISSSTLRRDWITHGLEATLEAYPDSIVFASDYPHGDGVFPGSTTELLETERLDAAQRDAVFFGNARRLYRL